MRTTSQSTPKFCSFCGKPLKAGEPIWNVHQWPACGKCHAETPLPGHLPPAAPGTHTCRAYPQFWCDQCAENSR